jgi:hypothetical protein
MPDQLQTIVQRMIDAGEPEENIGAVIRHYKAQGTAQPTAQPPAGGYSPVSTIKENFAKFKGATFGNPVGMLSTIGGLAGAPITGGTSLAPAVAASGLGAAGGAGLGLIADAMRGRGPNTAGGVVREMGKQGAIQGAAELVGGGVLAPAATRISRVIMDNAVRPTETLLREFPNVVETMVKERIPVGRILGRSGSQQAKASLRESAQTTRGLLRQADAAGVQIQPKEITAELPALRTSAQKSAGLPGGGPKNLADMEAEFAVAHGGPKTPSETKDLKRSAQALAKPIFRAQRMGAVVGPDQSMAAQFNDAIAGGSKTALENIPQFGKQIGASETRTKDLIGAVQAVRKAEARRLPLWSELASTAAGVGAGVATGNIGGGVGTALALRALTSPRVLSRAAIQMDRSAPLAAQGPRIAALIAALSGEEP